MKKYLLFLLFTIISLISFGQTPRTTPSGYQFGQIGLGLSNNLFYNINGIAYPRTGYAPAIWADTATANASSLGIKNIPLIQIATADGKNWYRNIGLTAWVEIGSGSGGSGTVTSFSSGNLSPLFTTSVATSSSTPALSFTLSNAGAYTLFGRGAATGVPSFLSSIDSNWIPTLHSQNYYNTKYAPISINGTVTSVSALTLGTTGTDLSSSVANGTTTPVITLNVPTASASNRGALSSTDWSTFNGKIGGSIALNQVAYGSGANTIAGLGLNTGALRVLTQTSSGAPVWSLPSGVVNINDTLYVLVTGQSNANGINYGDYDSAYNSKVFGYNSNTYTWPTLRRGVDPMGMSYPYAERGDQYDTCTNAAFHFAKRLQEKTGKYVKVFIFGWSGASITNWMGDYPWTFFYYIKERLSHTYVPRIDYFLWQQGESDLAMSDTAYLAKMDSLTRQFDSLSYFSRSTPIYILTPTNAAIDQSHIVDIQKAIASGKYDRRYTLIDGSTSPTIGDAYHLTSRAQSDLADSVIQRIYNPDKFSRNYIYSSTTRATFLTNAPRLSKGIIVRDSTSGRLYESNGSVFNVVSGLSNGNGTTAASDGSYVDLGGSVSSQRTLTLGTNIGVGIYIDGGTNQQLYAPLVVDSKVSDAANAGIVVRGVGRTYAVPSVQPLAWFYGMNMNSGDEAIIGIGKGAPNGNKDFNFLTHHWEATNSNLNYFSIGWASGSKPIKMYGSGKVVIGDSLTVGGISYFSSSVGIGVASPSAFLHVIGTTEQQRIGYDASNYLKTTVSSNGATEFDAVGGGGFTIKDSLNLNGQTIENYSAKYNVQTGTSYTLVAADNGKIVTCNNGSAITLTVPAGLPAGFTCTVIQLGAGQVTFTASSTTLHNRSSFTKTAGQYAVAAITMYTTDVFIFGGDCQ